MNGREGLGPTPDEMGIESAEGEAGAEAKEGSVVDRLTAEGFSLLSNFSEGSRELHQARERMKAHGTEFEVAAAFDKDGKRIENMVSLWTKEADEKAA